MSPPDRTIPSRAAVRGWRLLFAALLLAVLGLALAPQPPQALSGGWDKLNHAAAFAALAFSGRFAFRGGTAAWAALGAGLLALGIGIEVGQAFVPGRQCEWADLLADALGVAAGLAAAGALGWVLKPVPVRR
ncbi:MAG: VanZ family protein [Rhizobacter sp.]|jgi:VanZ family protein